MVVKSRLEVRTAMCEDGEESDWNEIRQTNVGLLLPNAESASKILYPRAAMGSRSAPTLLVAALNNACRFGSRKRWLQPRQPVIIVLFGE